MTLPIDMMREFCTRHNLGDDVVDEIQKIVDFTLIHIGRHLSTTETKAAETETTKKVAAPAKKPAAKKNDRCKCEGTNKKGEPCRFYAINDSKYCKSHQTMLSSDDKSESESESDAKQANDGDSVSGVATKQVEKKPTKKAPVEVRKETTDSDSSAKGVKNSTVATNKNTIKGLAKLKELAIGGPKRSSVREEGCNDDCDSD